MTVAQLIVSDFKKHKKYGANFFVIVFFTQGFWATFQYRIANYIHRKIKLQPFRAFFLYPMFFWQKLIEVFAGISIPSSAQIGHSFYVAHFGGIILNSKVVIGNNCNISQGVSIGVSGLNEFRGVPIIGDNVFIGSNSIVAGKITVGNNALIGSCSLVTSNVEENAVMLGVPAIKISEKSSKGYI